MTRPDSELPPRDGSEPESPDLRTAAKDAAQILRTLRPPADNEKETAK